MKYVKKGLLVFVVLSLFFPTTSYAKKVVIIDPGHGGKFHGTCGHSGNKTGYCEKDANLAVALRLKQLLMPSDITVYLTRSTDQEFGEHLKGKNGDFNQRMKIANSFAIDNNNNSIFISIHHNASPTNPFIRGIETYYYDGLNHAKPMWPHDPWQLTFLQDNKRLAEIIHPTLVDMLGLPNRKIRNNQSFYVLRNAQMPAILVELGFMLNRNEEKLIKDEDHQFIAATALAEGIITYFKVYEVFGDDNQKLATYQSKKDALNFAKKTKTAIRVFDKDNQTVIYDKTVSQVSGENVQ